MAAVMVSICCSQMPANSSKPHAPIAGVRKDSALNETLILIFHIWSLAWTYKSTLTICGIFTVVSAIVGNRFHASASKSVLWKDGEDVYLRPLLHAYKKLTPSLCALVLSARVSFMSSLVFDCSKYWALWLSCVPDSDWMFPARASATNRSRRSTGRSSYRQEWAPLNCFFRTVLYWKHARDCSLFVVRLTSSRADSFAAGGNRTALETFAMRDVRSQNVSNERIHAWLRSPPVAARFCFAFRCVLHLLPTSWWGARCCVHFHHEGACCSSVHASLRNRLAVFKIPSHC